MRRRETPRIGRDAQVNVHTSSAGAPPTYNGNREAGMKQREGRDERYENRAGKPDQAREENWRRGQGNPRSQFVGPCFVCQSVGYRPSECPYVICYWCRERGHVVRDCPQRTNLVCSKCGLTGAQWAQMNIPGQNKISSFGTGQLRWGHS